ncbi:alpha/beta fold hydrolase [Phreatobacter stygius]|uniref:Alpha/beta hydrolase n=1 Tax=Phreatobacter stygius TaxID=1940610 RepID=A0A4D7AW01_9HYPH|nr:alpha/beta hydrolase [Phreatobacter stygius]QCI63725.1 alpha/beta hydrolase [Phreatobacter stygius]
MTTFRSSTGTRFSLPLSDGSLSGLRWGADKSPPDLLFLHATGFNAQTYAPLLDPLSDRYAIMALDQRGHGFSDLPTDPQGIVDWMPYARDLMAVLDQLVPAGGKPLVVAGHSMGAIVSLLAAVARPRAVRGLVLLDPVMMSPLLRLATYTPWGRAKFKNFSLAVGAAKRRAVFGSKQEAVDTYRTRKAFMSWQPGFLEAYVDGGFVADAEGVHLACAPIWESATFSSHRHNSWGALKRTRMPVHLMAAAHGSTVTGGVEKVRRAAPQVATEVVAGTSHFFPMERPDHVRAALEAMLAKT